MDKAELVSHILQDLHAVHQGVDSYLQLMMNSDLILAQDEWDMICKEVKNKSNLVREMVDCAIELLRYEDLDDVPRQDEVVINQFCQDMFNACERYVKNDKIDLARASTLRKCQPPP